jgi:hypothetical protein
MILGDSYPSLQARDMTGTATEKSKVVYVFTGGPTDGSEPDHYFIEMTVKEAAIREIKSQPFFT